MQQRARPDKTGRAFYLHKTPAGGTRPHARALSLCLDESRDRGVWAKEVPRCNSRSSFILGNSEGRAYLAASLSHSCRTRDVARFQFLSTTSQLTIGRAAVAVDDSSAVLRLLS